MIVKDFSINIKAHMNEDKIKLEKGTMTIHFKNI